MKFLSEEAEEDKKKNLGSTAYDNIPSGNL
jgi:hypothetical protein